jgi:hypothetical protein
MEQPREQPQVGTTPYPYAYQAAPRPSAWRVFSSFLRLLLRRLIYAIVWVLRPLRNHVGASILTMILLAVIGFLAFSLYGPRMAEQPDPRAILLPPAPAVENYLTGRKTFNADLIWEAFSNDYQARQLQQGGSKATMQSSLQQEKRIGLQYRQMQYIGGVKLDDSGGHMYYYSVEIAMGNGSARLPIIFQTDRNDKIEFLISPLDETIQRIMSQ